MKYLLGSLEEYLTFSNVIEKIDCLLLVFQIELQGLEDRAQDKGTEHVTIVHQTGRALQLPERNHSDSRSVSGKSWASASTVDIVMGTNSHLKINTFAHIQTTMLESTRWRPSIQ